MQVPRLWVFAVPAVFLLAGCVAESGSAPDANAAAGGEAPANAAPPEFDESTGAIQGIVTDLELQPLAGAQVGITPSDLVPEPIVSVTDLTGTFTLSRVPPGEHAVSAQQLGYESAAKRVTVLAGEVVSVQFSLPQLPSDEPFHHIEMRNAAVTGVMVKLTPQCMYGTQLVPTTGNPTVDQFRTTVKTCNGQRRSCDPAPNCEVHFEELLTDNPGWVTQFAEATWAPQSGATGRGFMFDITAPNATRGFGGSIDQANPYTFFKMQPNPPIIWRIDNPETLLERGIAEADWCCDWFYRVFPGYCDLGGLIGNCETTPDYGIAVDNVLTVYYTVFFKEAAPADYSSLPDS